MQRFKTLIVTARQPTWQIRHLLRIACKGSVDAKEIT